MKIYDTKEDIIATYKRYDIKGIATYIAISMMSDYQDYLRIKPEIMNWLEEIL